MPLCHENVDLRSNELSAKLCCLFGRRSFHPASGDRDRLSLDITKLAHPLTESIEETVCRRKGVPAADPANSGYFAPL